MFENLFKIINAKLKYLLAGICMILAFLIAVPTLNFPFHPDEGHSLCKISSNSLSPGEADTGTTMSVKNLVFDKHRSVYFFALKKYSQIMGQAKLSLRLFNILIYSLGFFFFFILAQNYLKDLRITLLTTALMGIFPSLIFYSNYIQTYSLFFTVSIFQLLFFSKHLNQEFKNSKNYFLELYLILSLILYYVHLFSVFILAFQLAYIYQERFLLTKKQKIFCLLFTILIIIDLIFFSGILESLKINQYILSAGFYDSFKKFLGITLFLFEDGYTTDHSFIYQLFPIVWAILIFTSFIFFIQKKRKISFTKSNYHFLAISFILTCIFLSIYIFNTSNIEYGDLIYLTPSFFLVLGSLLQITKDKSPSVFWIVLSIYLISNALNFKIAYDYLPNENSSLESSLSFIKNHFITIGNNHSQTIYTNDIRQAQCSTKSYYESLYFPEKILLNSAIEIPKNSTLNNQILLIFEDNDYIFNKNLIINSIKEPMNRYTLYLIRSE